LIARQRTNLRKTFALSDEPALTTETVSGLAQAELDLAMVTTEFTQGLEARFGPMPVLHEAIEAMQGAVPLLQEKKLKESCPPQETALANLIKARQNLRQLLSQSQSASQCRQFDAQQKQKLRTPPKKEQQQLQQELEKLAQEERKLSSEMGGKSSTSRPSPAERQESAAATAAELQKQVRQDAAKTDLARERMDQAAQTIQASAADIKAGRSQEAGQGAKDAAAQLERLARQVAALKARDLAERLGKAQSLARQLAQQQEQLNQQTPNGDRKGQASEQQQVTEEAKTLADLLKRTLTDAAGSDAKVRQALQQAAETNSPAEIVEHLQQASAALAAGKTERARREGEQSAKMLDGLAQQLEAARRGVVQPQLEKLVAAEKLAAATQQALAAVATEPQKAEAERKMAELRDTVDSLKAGDSKLTAAAHKLSDAMQQGNSTWNSGGRTPRGFYNPPVLYVEGIQATVQALQAKIQEIILKDILLDKDEPVPPQYKKLVEQYYKVLSEDLR
jgi:hypothetical protein